MARCLTMGTTGPPETSHILDDQELWLWLVKSPFLVTKKHHSRTWQTTKPWTWPRCYPVNVSSFVYQVVSWATDTSHDSFNLEWFFNLPVSSTDVFPMAASCRYLTSTSVSSTSGDFFCSTFKVCCHRLARNPPWIYHHFLSINGYGVHQRIPVMVFKRGKLTFRSLKNCYKSPINTDPQV